MSQTQPEDLLDGWNKISNSQPHVLAQGRAPEASKPPRASPRTSAPQLLLRTPPASLEGCIRSIAQSHSRPSPLPSPENAQNASNTLILPQHLQDIVNAVVTALPPPSFARHPDTLSPSSCHFCSRAGHHLKSCMVVHMYLAQGKVRHNADGYIVLRSGSFIPRHLPGTCIRDRVDFLYCMRSPLTIAPTAAV
ncbi:hypothetical protein BD779DRAFT_1574528 [Infundibulicybe gibba]|nr:hypothetical protein BD779DRAFT_1574528 [Infundibulicybe gibba]